MEKTSYLEEVLFTDNLPVRVNTYTRNMTAVIQNHYHGELEFNLLYELGSIDFYVNGERHTIHTGEVGIINSYDIHSSIPSLPTKGDEVTGVKIFIQRDFLKLVYGDYGGYGKVRLSIPNAEANDRIALARWAFPRRSAAISLIIKKNKSRYNSGKGENPYYERKTICEPQRIGVDLSFCAANQISQSGDR